MPMHLWCIVSWSWVQYIFGVASLVLCIVSYIAQACYRSGTSSLWNIPLTTQLCCCAHLDTCTIVHFHIWILWCLTQLCTSSNTPTSLNRSFVTLVSPLRRVLVISMSRLVCPPPKASSPGLSPSQKITKYLDDHDGTVSGCKDNPACGDDLFAAPQMAPWQQHHHCHSRPRWWWFAPRLDSPIDLTVAWISWKVRKLTSRRRPSGF